MKKEIVWPFVYLSYISMFCLGFVDNIRGPLFGHILKEYSLTDGGGAWFFTTASLFSFFGSILAHVLVKKIDRIQGIRLASLFFIIGNAIVGVATNFYFVLLGSAIIGLSFGLMGILQNVLVTISTNTKRRQQLITGLHAVYGLSSLLAPLLVAALLTFRTSYREVFYVAALLPVFVLIYTLTFKPELFKLAKKTDENEHSNKKIWTKDKLYIASVIAIYSMVELMISTRLSLYLQRKFNYSISEASISLSYFFVLFLVGRVLFSLQTIHIPLKKQIGIMLFLSFICLCLGFYKYPLFLIASGFFMAPCYPFCVGYMTDVYSNELDSIMFVTFMLQAFFVVSMHTAVGYLSDFFGIEKALWIGPIFLLIALLLLVTFESFYHKHHLTARR
jgi:MFS family permease